MCSWTFLYNLNNCMKVKWIYLHLVEMFDTTQEIVVGVISLLALLVGTIISGIQYGAFASIIGFLFAIPFILLTIYSIRCMILGGCNVFAWIMTVLIGLFNIVGMFTIGQVNDMTESE